MLVLDFSCSYCFPFLVPMHNDLLNLSFMQSCVFFFDGPLLKDLCASKIMSFSCVESVSILYASLMCESFTDNNM